MTDFPFRMDRPAQFTAALPDACDVAVIGGGIIGVMTAWFLAKAGQRVVVCEKGRISGEQSGRNWGWVRQQGRDPAELPIMVEALRMWPQLAAETGEDLGFRQTGVLYLANTPERMARFEAWLPHARANGIDTRLLSRAEVGARMAHSDTWAGGIFTASDARAEPWVAVPALARAAVRAGVTIREDCAVRRLDVAAGRVVGVVTESGRIRADRVVLAGGAWSSLLARAEGITLRQLAARSSVAATVAMPEVYAGAAADSHYGFCRRPDGGYSVAPRSKHDFYIGPDAFRHFRHYIPQLKRDHKSTRMRPAAPAGFPDGWTTPRRWAADAVSPFERCRMLAPKPNMRLLNRALDGFAASFPQLGRAKIACAWAGMIDVMPDTVPVIDHVPALPGLMLATGMSGHGFGIGPGFGRVIADMVTGRAAGHDMTRFRLSRFSDGSPMDLGPTL